ncbi:MAG: 4'-phosphopantetheinyl transferase superfamily protein [Trichodesmium sp. St16_bin4-tuft]|uniref:Phosphopantethiene-protein transferase n=1 Tax=Trichodesmium erythraeum (strain IMS101) TaxID=203124 RepID=Q10VS6_TRIEI|nr:4'-phosphopantetheinyl transferase superfamily protein [Trichodesmium erythraeum GBRTRLIN201]MCH2048222.1 4'-phosphopantetheinyl transferase superfamily protein [Trichodesmium sp. ALOHA_ZT_67]MCL2928366.1 4'-phosphopantetheinyl transferase superfamily protein [Trichodesmium sp. MAG_R01]MDE5098982.1 4'-phosphopantetheinyl transferase superfamily protein [Trichodesmium sp. St16_bin4-tuft]
MLLDQAEKKFELSENNVHIWSTNLKLSSDKIEELSTILSPDEKNRANKFYFEKDKNRFIIARGTLRTILSRYLNIEPKKLQFTYSDRGKPYLKNTSILFNLSHSQDLALYGITKINLIGIDLEYIRPMNDAVNLAKRFFSLQEYKLISQLPPQKQQETFFKIWTCKEAYLKATGDGLAGHLEKVEICLTPEKPVEFFSINGDIEAASHWYLYQFIPQPNYIAAVVVAEKNQKLSFWQINNTDIVF